MSQPNYNNEYPGLVQTDETCYRFTDKAIQASERVLFSNWWREQLNQFGVKVNYFVNTYNVLSADNCLAVGERQRPMTKKKLHEFSSCENMPEEVLRNYERNRMMIDLSQIPQEYKDQILDAYAEEKEVGREHLFNYFMKKKLKNLLTDIQDF